MPDSSAITSPAFRKAALASERLRIVSLICVILVMVVISIVRGLLAGYDGQLRLMPLFLVPVAVFMAYESAMLRVVSRMLRSGGEPALWRWILSIFVETALPTAIIAMITHSPTTGPYRALVAPSVFAYAFFIILATLRLNPLLCTLTGVFAAAQYLAVVAYTYRRFPEPPETSGAFPLSIYVTYAICFLVAGVAAAGVSRQIRTHVIAALREADARQQIREMERDLGIARTIQEGLLPGRLPDLPGFEIAGWSRPAAQTGGDYYYWQPLPDGRVAVSLADVTGHGIGPALITAACRAYSRASFLTAAEFGEQVDRIHRLLGEDLPADRFVTFVAALITPNSNRVRILSAGQGPIFHYCAAEGRVRSYNADDLPFGVMAENTYGPARDLDMAAGDILILITDGFFEWPNEHDEQYGTERLGRLIGDACDLPAADLIDRLYSDVLRHAGPVQQQDDLTAVVIRRTNDRRGPGEPSVLAS